MYVESGWWWIYRGWYQGSQNEHILDSGQTTGQPLQGTQPLPLWNHPIGEVGSEEHFVKCHQATDYIGRLGPFH